MNIKNLFFKDKIKEECYKLIKESIVINCDLDVNTNIEEINKFIRSLMCKLTYVNFNIFNKNMQNIKINYDRSKLFINGNLMCSGYYSPTNNELNVNLKDNLALNHELLHVCSSFINNRILYSGFEQINLNNMNQIGFGINEGYTEYLAEKITGLSKDSIYFVEKRIARALELVIGENRMLKYYFNGDLRSLFDYLCKYMNCEDTLNFINNVDKITSNFYKDIILKDDYQKNIKLLSDIFYYLGLLNHIIQIKNHKILSDEDTTLFISMFRDFHINGVEYSYNILENCKKMKKLF